MWPNVVLTERQQEVLLALADGWRNAEIAEELCISEETVKSHVRAMTFALEARNRTHLVALAYHRGLLVIPARVARTG